MKRAVVLALTALCALAVAAVPAQGQSRKAQTRPGRSGVCVVVVKQGAKARSSQRRAVRRSPRCRGPRGFRGPRGRAGPRGADGRDGAAGKDGTNGTNGTNGATGPAGPKGDKGEKGDPGTPASGTRYGYGNGAVTISATSFDPLGGPRVTVRVPESGTIQVAASTVFEGGDGLVRLTEDGVPMAGQNDFCATDASGDFIPNILFDGNPVELDVDKARFSTGGNLSLASGCSTTGAPAALYFQTTPGTHEYGLEYAAATCGCGPPDPVTISERRLWVTPLP